jgi:hypothetical protein
MKLVHEAVTGQESVSDTSSPYSALVCFYSAFNQQDFELMQANWLQSEQASMSNPLGGIKHGWSEIREVYHKIFQGPAKVYVEFYDYTMHTTETMFLAAGRERGILELGNEKIELTIRTTRIFILHEQQWKQVHHHGSMDDPKLLSRYQAILLSK